MKKFLLVLLTLSLLCLTACGETKTESTSGNTASTDTSKTESTESTVIDIWQNVEGDVIDKPVDIEEGTQLKLFKNNECELYTFAEDWGPATVNGTEYDCEWRYLTKYFGTYTVSGDKIEATVKAQRYLAIEVRGNEAEKYKADFLESVKDSDEYETYKSAIESVCEFPYKEEGSMKLTVKNAENAFEIAVVASYDKNGKLETEMKVNEDGSSVTAAYDEDGNVIGTEERNVNNEKVKETVYENGEILYVETVESTENSKVTTRVDGDGNVIKTDEANYKYDGGNKYLTSHKITENGVVILDYSAEYYEGGVMALEIEKTIDNGIEHISTTAYDASGSSYYDKKVSTENGELIEYYYWHYFKDTESTIHISYISDLDVYSIREEFHDEHGQGMRDNEIPADEYDPAEWEKDYK